MKWPPPDVMLWVVVWSYVVARAWEFVSNVHNEGNDR